MTLNQFRKIRNMSFVKRGMKVFSTYSNRYGKITGANDSCNLNIKFDGDAYSRNCHPYFKLKYFDNNGFCIAVYDTDIKNMDNHN